MAKSDQEEIDFLDMLFEKGIDVLKLLVGNPSGVGVISILGGLLLKSLPADSAESQNQAYRFTSQTVENLKKTGLFKKDLDQDAWCREAKVRRPSSFDRFCEVYEVSTGRRAASKFDVVVDVFPFEGFGIPKAFGEVHISDLLILSGLIAIGGQAITKVI